MRPQIVIPRVALEVVRFAAVETFPKECIGFFLGHSFRDTYTIEAAVPAQIADRRPWSVNTTTDEELDEFFGRERVIGHFHSHPNYVPTASDDDREDTEEGDCMVIVSLFPGKRSPWCFRLAAYSKAGARLIRASVRIV